MSRVIDGLQDVAVAESRICFIDGEKGRLVYSGYDIEDLAEHTSFEETAFLLWNEELPKRAELDALNEQLLFYREVDEKVYDFVSQMPISMPPMDALRTLVSYLSAFDEQAEDNSHEVNYAKSIRLTAQIPVLVAAYDRHQRGKEILRPLKHGGLAHNFLYMLSGEEPDPFVARTLDTILVLHAEHGMNASTFAARVTVSTLSDIYAGTVSAIGALKGPLHGGANSVVLEMLKAIDDPQNAAQTVERILDGSFTLTGMTPKRVPGFGHRVYKAFDPRATALWKLARTLGERAGETRWIEISEAVVETCRAAGLFDRGIYPNVDFFSASSYYTMGIGEPLFVPAFAIARITGWTAHMIEQLANNRLIRPHAVYTGPMGQKVVPIHQR